ncbi:hypothetical protein H0H81_002165 [Sphagnurus paluster]|uniref:Uncharacterized protein n=1 Tax=Sphagnurus paluster TaxID=117069 RepID=A0A9P7FVJ2_9AGAR|nr:hypothetical protein H0H81_002165 [Sphagnurus paluster]
MLSVLVFSALLLVSVSEVDARPRRSRLNDWKKPCLNGECFYDLPETAKGGAGSLKIWGSPDAISDITAAAGWSIIGCSPDALVQDIRLVCNNDDPQSSCKHLYRKLGATGKVVRLPEECGKNAFARVARSWVPKDQTIPAEFKPAIMRRSGTKPLVMALTLDTNFAAINPAETGEISIAITGSTIPGAEGNLAVTPGATTGNDPRDLFSWIKDAWKNFNTIDQSFTQKLPPIDYSKNFPLLSQSISCPGPPAYGGSVNADLNTNIHAVISLGVAAVGTIVPPQITEFGAFVGLDADLRATLGLKGSAFGTADTGLLTLYQVGLPGLDFPGILTVGPTFKVTAQASARLDVGIDVTADLSYSVAGAKIIYPPVAGTSSNSGIFVPGSAPLKLAVSGNLASTTTLGANLTPRIDLGLTALGGVAKATVFINLDTHASVNLNLKAGANAGGALNTTNGSTSGGANAQVNGCIKASAGLGSVVGADAQFFNLFNKATTFPLYTKDWEVYSKCFQAQTSTGKVPRSPIFEISDDNRISEERRALSSLVCPASGLSKLLVTVA